MGLAFGVLVPRADRADRPFAAARAAAPAAAAEAGEQRFDIAGALLLASGLATLLLAINALPRLRDGDTLAFLLLPAACVSLVAFVWWEARTKQPVVQVALFRHAAFAIINAASCLLYLVTFSVMLISPYFLVHHTGLSLPQAGLVLASGFVAMALTSPLAGRVVARFGAGRIAPVGALAIGAGLFSIGNWRPETAPSLMVLSLAVQGCGLACFQVAYMELVMAATPPAHRGVAGSLGMLTRTIGTVTGASLLTLGFQTLQSIALAGGEAAPEAFLSAYHAIFRVVGVVAVLTGGIVAWSARRRQNVKSSSPGPLNRDGAARAIFDQSAFGRHDLHLGEWHGRRARLPGHRNHRLLQQEHRRRDPGRRRTAPRKPCAICAGSR